MELRNVERRLLRGRETLTSAGLAAASLFASVAWLLVHDQSRANAVGTAVIVALPIAGVMHACRKSVGLAGLLANAFALLIAIFVAVLLTMSWPGPAV